MSDIMFSILVVALNPGKKLEETVKSVLCQDYDHYEIIVKDGMSSDGSVEKLEEAYGNKEDPASPNRTEDRLRIVRRPDKGIYDAMNQAVTMAKGDYVLFLNCGDGFFDCHVLRNVAEAAGKKRERAGNGVAGPCIFYGNTFYKQTDVVVHSSPSITGFTCYRNIPCHQSCFYDRRLFDEKKYNEEYRIRADYDHFLWCYYRIGAEMVYMDIIVSAYEGGGYSEEKRNRSLDEAEHRKIVSEYMGRGELIRYRIIMAATLAPLRRWMAGNHVLSGVYHRLKDRIYG